MMEISCFWITVILLFLIGLAFNYCSNSDAQGKCAQKECIRLTKRDFKYSMFIMLGIIIVLVTSKCGDSAQLLNYISFGSTLSSIILSVLAIIMTILAESKNDAVKTRLENLTTIIENASSNISQQVTSTSRIYSEMGQRFSDYENLLNNQSQILNRVEEHTRNIEERIARRDYQNISDGWMNINMDGEKDE
ncbi:MAG: hypothetical protein Q4E64_05515 [Phascolarctobacterium sp.]|uniref:hypothetical protein n=1 Tax=Phascolarctobacterium sp. TaxID=2049039 RepID=UPI0026DB682B|nr:hypothetical protein [Phascolarctobacterium sp.]MDO4921265.1 hypothetical protein [Phascolarctobacterium sp.]